MPVEACRASATVAVATMNAVKVRAVARVFRRFCNVAAVTPVDPPPLPRQPRGSIEVVLGAIRRAVHARGWGDYGVGVEAGPIEFHSTAGYVEAQVAVIVGPSMRASVGLSPSFELPAALIERVLGGVELGEAVEVPRPGDIGEVVGYVGYATMGYVTRQDLAEAAVAMALIPWIAGFEGDLAYAEELASRLEMRLSQH